MVVVGYDCLVLVILLLVAKCGCGFVWCLFCWFDFVCCWFIIDLMVWFVGIWVFVLAFCV